MCAVRNCLESRLRDFLPSVEVLSQMYTDPAPHHHTTHPLSKPIPPKSPSPIPAPASPSGSADLADASSAEVTAAVSSRDRRQSLSMFHFFETLRQKAEMIQILASFKAQVVKRPLSEQCMAFMDKLKCLPVNLQRLVLGLQPSMANYEPGFMVSSFVLFPLN